MNKRERAKTYNLGEYSFVTLDALDREELFEHISCLNNNIEAHKQRENVIRARLKKCMDYLESQGLSIEEINEIIRLDCENI